MYNPNTLCTPFKIYSNLLKMSLKENVNYYLENDNLSTMGTSKSAI
jgi:hypothetical protein